jgi:hypothetical protein
LFSLTTALYLAYNLAARYYLFFAITSEINAIFRNSVRLLLRVEWTSAYILARAMCFQPSTIESVFKKAGIYPMDPEIILSTLPTSKETLLLIDNDSSLPEESLRFLRERLRDSPPPIITFEDFVEEAISRGVLSPRIKAFIRELLVFARERNTKATLPRRELTYMRRTRYLIRVRSVRRVNASRSRAVLSFREPLS